MKLDQISIDEFKDYIVQSMNDDVYYELKHWVNGGLDDDQEYSEAMDYFINNLHGSLQWVEN